MGQSKIEILYKGKWQVYYGPAGWEDMNRMQLLAWCSILQQELTKQEALVLACYLLYKIPKHVVENLSPVFMAQLAIQMEWLLVNKLTKNVIESFRLFFRRYYGPANKLSNLTISEYRFTELFYDLYLQTKQKKYLYMLVAVLFRPGKKRNADRDFRKPLLEADVMKRAKFFEWALHPHFVKAIQLYYEGCRAYIRQSFPLVYPKPIEADELPHPFAPKPSVGLQDLEDHILQIAGGKFGNFEETGKVNLYVFLKHLSQKVEEYEESKKK